jgi:hypothetical protein
MDGTFLLGRDVCHGVSDHCVKSIQNGSRVKYFRHYFTPPGMIRDIGDIAPVFLKYGPVPRFCIALAGNDDAKAAHDEEILRALEDLDATADWLPKLHKVDGINYHLFGVHPIENLHSGRPFPLSSYITQLLVQRAEAVGLAKAKAMFDAFLIVSSIRDSASRTFECLVHARLRRGAIIRIKQISGNPYPYLQKRLEVNETSPGADPMTLPFLKPDKMAELLRANNGQLLTLFQSLSIDSVMRRDTTLWLIQVTLAKSHTIDVASLERVLEGIPASYKPSKKNKAILVVITLKDGDPYESVDLVFSKVADEKLRDGWEAKLERYVAEVSQRWLFEQDPSNSESKPKRSQKRKVEGVGDEMQSKRRTARI